MEQQHTFGGLGLMGRLIDFETVEEGAALGGDPGGSSFPAPAIPAADDAGVDESGLYRDEFELGDEPDPAEETAPAWAGPSQQEWDSVVGFSRQLQQLLEEEGQPQPAAEAPAPEFNPEEFDPNDPQQIEAMIDRRAQQLLDERMGPYQPILDEQAQQAGEKMVHDALDKIAGELGEFDRGQALLLTNSLLANGVQPEQAFRQAAAIRLADEQAMKKAGVDEYIAAMGKVGDVDPEPNGGGGGSARESEQFTYDPRDPDKYQKLADRFVARRNADRAHAG